jgi:hypothetical protein
VWNIVVSPSFAPAAERPVVRLVNVPPTLDDMPNIRRLYPCLRLHAPQRLGQGGS